MAVFWNIFVFAFLSSCTILSTKVNANGIEIEMAPKPDVNSWKDFLQRIGASNSTDPIEAHESDSIAKEDAGSGNTFLKSTYDQGPLMWPIVLGNGRNNQGQQPCNWPGNTLCTTKYEPLCITDLRCIFVVQNRCHLDKLNCNCQYYHILHPSFCNNFLQPNYRRCNLRIFIQ